MVVDCLLDNKFAAVEEDKIPVAVLDMVDFAADNTAVAVDLDLM